MTTLRTAGHDGVAVLVTGNGTLDVVDGYDSVAAAIGDTLCLWWEEPGPQVAVVLDPMGGVQATLIGGRRQVLEGGERQSGVVAVVYPDGRYDRYLVAYVLTLGIQLTRTEVTPYDPEPHGERDRDVWTPQQDMGALTPTEKLGYGF